MTLCFTQAHCTLRLAFPYLAVAHVSSYNFLPPTARFIQNSAPKKSQPPTEAKRSGATVWFVKMEGWIGCGIDIGRRSLAFPVTPPCIRVRTRRFVRIKRRQCNATEEVPSFRNKWRALHRREPVFG